MKNKKTILIIIGIILILTTIFIIFRITNYKNTKMGNNIANKTLQEVENYILNISSYDAEIELVVESNKNTNKYIINQKYVSPNIASQEVIEPMNIQGLKIKFDGNKLEVSNTKLNLNTIYENYEYIADNVLWLCDFIDNYKNNNGKICEENGVIVMETKCDGNKYAAYEKLYIDRNANKITKLVIEDENNKTKIYITYNKIEIGSLIKENVLAFKREFIGKREL